MASELHRGHIFFENYEKQLDDLISEIILKGSDEREDWLEEEHQKQNKKVLYKELKLK